LAYRKEGFSKYEPLTLAASLYGGKVIIVCLLDFNN